MAKTKKRSKKYSTAKLKKRLNAKLLRDVIAFLFLTLAFYTVMHIAIYSNGSKDCAAIQEIEAGCQTDMPLSTILLVPSIMLAAGLQVGLKRMHEIKHHLKKVQK